MTDITALLEEIRAGLEGVTGGPWRTFDGCSWRRVGQTATIDGQREDDCAVLAPTIAPDGHPDLLASRGNNLQANLQHIARMSPDNVTAILDAYAALKAENELLRTSLSEYVWGDDAIADVLWGHMPDERTMTFSIPLGAYRRARAVLKGDSNGN